LKSAGVTRVHALVGALSRENRGDQELEWIPEIESDLGVGIGLLELANDLAGPGRLASRDSTHETPPTGWRRF